MSLYNQQIKEYFSEDIAKKTNELYFLLQKMRDSTLESYRF